LSLQIVLYDQNYWYFFFHLTQFVVIMLILAAKMHILGILVPLDFK